MPRLVDGELGGEGENQDITLKLDERSLEEISESVGCGDVVHSH